MRADAEALDRECAQAEVASLLVQLRAAEDVHALAVGELEAQAVELAARHRHAERRAVGGIFQREEDARPALVAPELGHLALDPDRRQTSELLRDASVERGDGVDGAVVVRERFDLAHAASLTSGRTVRLKQDLGRGLVRAAAVRDELDGEMQVGIARCEPLGEGERITGLDQHVEPPALDFRAFAGLW